MSSVSPAGRSAAAPKNHRVSLCSFTFSDGRRCRSPRIASHPHFCYCHAQKEARARAAETLGKDLAYFFSGDYLSACDLTTALGRLIPAVIRGDVKPRTARTVAYLAQTLLQAIHLSKHEFINAFGTDGWRKSIRNSVSGNYDYRFPPDPQPEQPEPPAPSALRTNLRSAPPHSHPAPPHNPMPPTSAEFVQQVVAGLQTGAVRAPQPANTPLNCHSEQSEESAFSAAHSPLATRHSPLPPTRDPYALHFDHNCRLRIDGQPF